MLLGNKGADINRLIAQARETQGAVIVDVRTPQEYAQGHIGGGINIPLGEISTFPQHVEDKKTPVYVYCRSGARSASAAQALREMGYTHVTNAGGIMSWKGSVE